MRCFMLQHIGCIRDSYDTVHGIVCKYLPGERQQESDDLRNAIIFQKPARIPHDSFMTEFHQVLLAKIKNITLGPGLK